MARSVWGAVAVVLAVATSASVSAADDADADVLRFPGRPGGGTRPRGTPMFPGVRPSPPGFPRTTPPPPSSASSSSSPGGAFQPACPKAPLGQLPGFPGLLPGGGSSSSTDCVTPLASLMSCGTFLTGSAAETPMPQGECCAGLSAFLNSSSTSTTGDGATQQLRCLCPVILGDVNRMLPKPIDPVRMMYLPIACGVVLPPQAIYICFTGQSAPPVVGRIPEIWENPSSSSIAASSP